MSMNGQQRNLAPILANLQVVNRHTFAGPRDQSYIYIGRGTPLGNNWSHSSNTNAQYLVGSREEAVDRYRQWLWQQIQRGNNPATTALNELKERALKGEKLSLACSCSPQLCHGDVVKATIEHLVERDRQTRSQTTTQTIFVSGSRSVTTLPVAVRDQLDQHIRQGDSILVGDAAGADQLVQEYLKTANYQNVTVCHIGSQPRNNLGFETVRVEGTRQADKDAYMAAHADAGLAIWDGKSKGTAINIARIQTNVVSVTAPLSSRGDQARVDILANGPSDNLRSQFTVEEGLTRGQHTTNLHRTDQFARDAFERGTSLSDNILAIPRDPDSRPQDGAKVIIGTEAHAVDFVRGFISDRAEAQEKGQRLFQIAEKACGQWTDSHGRLSIFTHLYDAIRRDETGAYRSNEDRAAVIDKVLEQSAQWTEQLPEPAPEPTAEEIHEFTLALAEEAKHAQPQVEPEPMVISEEAARDPHLLYVHELGSNTHGLATIGDLTGLSSESFFHGESTNIDENQVYSDLFEHAIADAIEFNTPDHLALDPSPGGAALEATFDRVNLDALPPALPDGLSETNEKYLIEELLPTIDAKIESGLTRSQILAPVYGDNRAQQAETLQQRVYNSGNPWVEGPPSREDQLNALSSLRLLIAGEYKHETRSFSREAIDWAKDNYHVNPDQLRAAGKLKVGQYAQIVSEQQTARTEWLHSHPGQQAPFRAQVAKINALETAGHNINTLIAALNPTKAELLRSLDTVQARIEAGKHATEQRLTTFAQLEQQDVELQRAAQQYAHDTRTSNPFAALKATVDRNEHERQIDARQELNRGNNARYEYLVSSGAPVAGDHRQGSGDSRTTTSFAMLQNDQAKERKTERAKLLSHLVNPEIEAARSETAAALDKERRFFTQLAGREVQTSADARSAVEPALSNLTVVTKVADNTRARLDAAAPAPVAVPDSNDHIYVSLVSNEQLRVPIASAQEYNVAANALQECRFESSVWSSLHSPAPITGHDEERDDIANFVGDYVNFRLNDYATNQLARNPLFREYSQRLSNARTTDELVETATAIRKENYQAYQQLQAHKADPSIPAPAKSPLNVSEMRQVFLTATPTTTDKRLAGTLREMMHGLAVFGKDKTDRVELLAQGKLTPSHNLARLLENLEHRHSRPALNHFYASLRNPAPVRANTFNLYEAHRALAPFERDYLHQHALAAKYEVLNQPATPERQVENKPAAPTLSNLPSITTERPDSASYHRYSGQVAFYEAEKLAEVNSSYSGQSTIAQDFTNKDVLTVSHIVNSYDASTQKDVISYLQESQDQHYHTLADMISLAGDFQSAGWQNEIEPSDLHLPENYSVSSDSVLNLVNHVQADKAAPSHSLSPGLTESIKAKASQETWKDLHASALKDPSLLVNGPASFLKEIRDVHTTLHSAEQLQARSLTASNVRDAHINSCVAKATAAVARATFESNGREPIQGSASINEQQTSTLLDRSANNLTSALPQQSVKEFVSLALNPNADTQNLSPESRDALQLIEQTLTDHDRGFAAQLETYAAAAREDYLNSFQEIDRAAEAARATEQQLISEIAERYESASKDVPNAHQQFETIKDNLERNILGEQLQNLLSESKGTSQAAIAAEQAAARDVLPADVVLAAEATAIEGAWQSFEPQEVRDSIAGHEIDERLLAEAYNVIDRVDAAQTAHSVFRDLEQQLSGFVDTKVTEFAETARTEVAIRTYNEVFDQSLDAAAQTEDAPLAQELQELQGSLKDNSTNISVLVSDAREGMYLTPGQQDAVLKAHEEAGTRAQQVQEQPLFANLEEQQSLRETVIAELKGPDKKRYETLKDNSQQQRSKVVDAFKQIDSALEKLSVTRSEVRMEQQFSQYQQLANPVAEKVNDYIKQTVNHEGLRALMDPLRHDEHVEQVGMAILQAGQEHQVNLDRSPTGLGQIEGIATNLFTSLRDGLERANHHLLQGIELGAHHLTQNNSESLRLQLQPQVGDANGKSQPATLNDRSQDSSQQATLDLTHTNELIREGPFERDLNSPLPDQSSPTPTASTNTPLVADISGNDHLHEAADLELVL